MQNEINNRYRVGTGTREWAAVWVAQESSCRWELPSTVSGSFSEEEMGGRTELWWRKQQMQRQEPWSGMSCSRVVSLGRRINLGY